MIWPRELPSLAFTKQAIAALRNRGPDRLLYVLTDPNGMHTSSRLRTLLATGWLPAVLAAAGAAIYLLQSWQYAHNQASVLDEGLYLYKGWLFASGRYVPFQDNGPWTNHMPLSFLIPGWFQVIFTPGLRTGRMLAILLGLLTLLGLWLLARRLGSNFGLHAGDARQNGGMWWGAGAIWAVALNPAIIKIFSLMASQGLAACMLIWVLVLTIGPGRPAWQLLLGAALAGAVPLTRINLLPVLPLLLIYLAWEYGWKTGLAAAAAGGLVFIGGHLLYWPGILRMWAPWFPPSLTPFLDPWRRPPGVLPGWRPQFALTSRLMSFFQGLRYHFVPLVGSAAFILLWPRHWFNRPQMRASLFLFSLFGSLFLMHAWASLGQNYCVFCFPVYLSFFSLSGILLIAASAGAWNREARVRAPVLALFLLLLAIGIGFSAFDVLGPALVTQPLVRRVMLLELPRVAGVGGLPLWGLIANRYGMDYEAVIRQGQLWGRIGASISVAILAAIAILLAARYWSGGLTKRQDLGSDRSPSFGTRMLWLLLVAGFIFSPVSLLGGGYRTYDCGGDVIAAYEAAGAHLRSQVSAGSRVYWAMASSPVPLLYLPDIEIFPAQLNGVYSFKRGGEPQRLAAFGLWNQALAETWAAQAEVILIPGSVFQDPGQAWLLAMVESGAFDELAPTPPVHPCSPRSQLHLFLRVKP